MCKCTCVSLCQPLSACVSRVFLDMFWTETLEEAREAALAFEYSIDILFAAQHPDPLSKVTNGCQMVVKWLSNGCQMVVKWLSNGPEMDQVDTILCFRTGFYMEDNCLTSTKTWLVELAMFLCSFSLQFSAWTLSQEKGHLPLCHLICTFSWFPRTLSSLTGGRLRRGMLSSPVPVNFFFFAAFICSCGRCDPRYCMTYFLFDLLSWFPIDLLVQAILGLCIWARFHMSTTSALFWRAS